MSDDSRRRRGLLSRLGGTSVATRLAAAVILLAMVSLLIATFVGGRTGNDLGEDLIDEQLAAMQASSALEIQSSVNSLLNSTTTSANSPMASDALARFGSAHTELSSIPIEDLSKETEQVLDSLRERYLLPLDSEGDSDVDLRGLTSLDPATIYLQFHYPTEATAEDIEPILVDDALDGSTWSQVHADIHPIYRDVVEQQHLTDLLLVEPTSATVVYSAAKRPP